MRLQQVLFWSTVLACSALAGLAEGAEGELKGLMFGDYYYIASGVRYWHTGDFALNREHPPLIKLLAGLPLLFAPGVWWDASTSGVIAFPQTWFYLLNGEELQRNLFLARAPLCFATAPLGGYVYRLTRRLFRS